MCIFSNTFTVLAVLGFGIWTIDNTFCSSLTTFKRYIGMPWSFIFELHGWWHIFTGIGAYTCESYHPIAKYGPVHTNKTHQSLP